MYGARGTTLPASASRAPFLTQSGDAPGGACGMRRVCDAAARSAAEADTRLVRRLADVDDVVQLQVDAAVGGLELVPAVALQCRAQPVERVLLDPHGQRRTAL